MSKSTGSMSVMGRLFKNTKIPQLQNSIGDSILNANSSLPTHQIIEAPTDSFSRRDFGLKMRIPKKIKTRRIIVNDLDNKYGLPNFETLNGDYFLKKRFRELGIPVNASYNENSNNNNNNLNNNKNQRFFNNNNNNLNNNNDSNNNDPDILNSLLKCENPLFESSKEFSKSKLISGTLDITNQPLNSINFIKNIKPELKNLRKPFLKWLTINNIQITNNYELSSYFKSFIESENLKLSNNANKNEIPKNAYNQLSGTAGLSYTLKGRLFQTPNGVKSNRVVPGRIVGNNSSSSKAAIGGFIANITRQASNDNYVESLVSQTKMIDENKFSRQVQVPLVIDNVTLNLKNKNLNLNAVPVTKISSSNIQMKNSVSRPANDPSLMRDILDLLKVNANEETSNKN